MNETNIIPNGWTETTLLDVTSHLGDGLHGTPNYSDDGEYYFINGNNLNDGKIEIKPETRKCSFEEYNKYKKKLNDRTILVSINGSLGYFAYYNNEKCFLGKSACYFNVKEDIDKMFVGYQIRSNYFQKYIERLAGGTTIKNVSLKTMREFPFLIPKNLEEQKSIAAILTAFDDKIELLQAQNNTLEATAQTIFAEWFGKYSLEDELPEGWRVGKLGDIVEIFDSKRVPLSKNERDERKGNIPYHGATSIMDYVNDFLFDGIYLLFAEDGSVIDDNGNPFLQYVWGKFWVNNHAHILQGKNGFSTEMLFVLTKKMKVMTMVNGAVQLKINQGNLLGFEIVIPKTDLLLKFDKIIQPLFEKFRLNATQTQTLVKTRDELLPRLMSGEVRVKVSEL